MSLISKKCRIDYQPYLLTGTDDWALSEEKALELLEYLEDQGVEIVHCVPFVKKENKQNSLSFLQNRFDHLLSLYKGNLKLRLAACYRLDEDFPGVLQAGQLLTLGERRQVLVDVSPIKESLGIWKLLQKILEELYVPVVMQPERVTYWNTTDFMHLKEMGCKLMGNLYSLYGYNGDDALRYSRILERHGTYDFFWSGMEDTKIMRYIENFENEEDKS